MSTKKNTSWVLGLGIVVLGMVVLPGFGQEVQPAPQEQEREAEKQATGEEISDDVAVRAGTKVVAELESAVDTRKARPGNEVSARVAKDVKQDGRTVIRKGDRLLGRVQSVEAGGEGNAGSRLAVEFDRLVRGESQSELNTVVTAVLSTPQQRSRESEPMMAPPPMPSPPPARGGGGSSSGGGLLGGVSSTVGSTIGLAGSATGTVGGTLDTTLDSAANTSAGLAGSFPERTIRVGSEGRAEQQATSDSVFSTRQEHLRLESGTRMEFRVVGQEQAETR